jgi:hypothetical protein
VAITLDRRLARDVVRPCADLGILPDVPAGGDWLTAAELLEPAGLEVALEAMHVRWSTPDRRVDGAFLTGHLAWYLGIATIGPWLRDGALVDPALDAVAVHGGADGLDGVAVDGDRAVQEGCSPHDLTDQLHDHTDRFVRAMRRSTPLGERAIRALTADALAGVFQWAGRAAGDEPRALSVATDVLAGPAWRWRGSFLVVRDGRSDGVLHERGSCCLSYRCAGEVPCDTCPLRTREDRRARARDRTRMQGHLTD